MAIIINTSGEQGVKIINGEIKNTVTVNNGKVVFENVQMNLPGRCINVLHDADVTLDKDCDIVATKDTPVFVNCDDGTHGPVLNVHGHVKATYRYTGANGSVNPNTGLEAEDGEFAIAGNGTRGNAATEINICEDAVVETEYGVALYQPQKGVLNIKAEDADNGIGSLSGGNQQKAIIARELDREHDLLIAVQPTRGLDVGAIEFIHKEIIKERDAGKGVLLVSLELEEVMNLADRILVMYEGEIVGEFEPSKVSVNELGLYMAGAKRMDMEA